MVSDGTDGRAGLTVSMVTSGGVSPARSGRVLTQVGACPLPGRGVS